MEISALQPRVKATDVQFDKLAANKNVSERDKVSEACRQFEAVLLRQILGAARKTVISSSATHETATTGIYNDMVTNQMADGISRSGSFGLAKALESQLVHQVLRPADAAQGVAAPIKADAPAISITPDKS